VHWEWKLVRLLEQADLFFRHLLTAAPGQRAAYYPQDMELAEGFARGEDALVVGVRLRGNEGESVRVELEQVVGEDAVHDFAVAEAHAHPEAVHFRPSMEDARLGLSLGSLEILNKTNGFDLAVGDHSHGSLGFQQLDAVRQQVRLRIDETGERFAVEAPDQDLLGCRTCQRVTL